MSKDKTPAPVETTTDAPTAQPEAPQAPVLSLIDRLKRKIADPGLDATLGFESAAWIQEKTFARLGIVGLSCAEGDLWVSTKVGPVTENDYRLIPVATDGSGQFGPRHFFGATLWLGKPGTAEALKIASDIPLNARGEERDTVLYRALTTLASEYGRASAEDREAFRAEGVYYEHVGTFGGEERTTQCLAWRLSDLQIAQRVTFLVTRDDEGQSRINVSDTDGCVSFGKMPAFSDERRGNSNFARSSRVEGTVLQDARKCVRQMIEKAIAVAGPIPGAPQRQIERLSRADRFLQAERAKAGVATPAADTTAEQDSKEAEAVIDAAFGDLQ